MNTHRTDNGPFEQNSFDERTWKNYDWTTKHVERDLSSFVWTLAFVVAMGLVVYSIVGFQSHVITAITSALVR